MLANCDSPVQPLVSSDTWYDSYVAAQQSKVETLTTGEEKITRRRDVVLQAGVVDPPERSSTVRVGWQVSTEYSVHVKSVMRIRTNSITMLLPCGSRFRTRCNIGGFEKFGCQVERLDPVIIGLRLQHVRYQSVITAEGPLHITLDLLVGNAQEGTAPETRNTCFDERRWADERACLPL